MAKFIFADRARAADGTTSSSAKIFHSRLIASRGYLGTILEIKPSPSHCNKKLPIRSAETLWRRVEHKAEKFRPSIVNVRARPSVSSKQ